MKIAKVLGRRVTSLENDGFISQILAAQKILTEKYLELGIDQSGGIWNQQHINKVKLNQFRGDNIYVWQTRQFAEINYFISYLYSLKRDQLGLLNVFKETGEFGAQTFEFNGNKISRDLIDSNIEINYLNEILGLSTKSNLQVLDIGAGYGRFAKRIIEAFPSAKVFCVDAIPLSTCISKIYLDREIHQGSAMVCELGEISTIPKDVINLAVNIHSFSEMSLESVKFWLNLIVEKGIEYIFIVPNSPKLTLNNGTDFSHLFQDAGFGIIDQRSKYEDEEFAKFGIYPSTYYILKQEKLR